MVDNFLADLIRDYWEIISACAALLIMIIRMESSIRSNRTLTDERINNLKERMDLVSHNLETKQDQHNTSMQRDMHTLLKMQEKLNDRIERVWQSIYQEKA